MIEIKYFIDIQTWRYDQSSNMIADIETRPGVTLKDDDSNPIWTNPFPRLTLDCQNLYFLNIFLTYTNIREWKVLEEIGEQ